MGATDTVRAYLQGLQGRIVAAFAAQGVIGLIIGLFAPTATGYAPEAYSWAFGFFLVLQMLALSWYLSAPRLKESAYA